MSKMIEDRRRYREMFQEHNISRLMVEYHGEGDEGYITGFSVLDGEGLPTTFPKRKFQDMEDFFYRLVAGNHIGFETNEGSFGTIEWDITPDHLCLEHTDRIERNEEQSPERIYLTPKSLRKIFEVVDSIFYHDPPYPAPQAVPDHLIKTKPYGLKGSYLSHQPIWLTCDQDGFLEWDYPFAAPKISKKLQRPVHKDYQALTIRDLICEDEEFQNHIVESDNWTASFETSELMRPHPKSGDFDKRLAAAKKGYAKREHELVRKARNPLAETEHAEPPNTLSEEDLEKIEKKLIKTYGRLI